MRTLSPRDPVPTHSRQTHGRASVPAAGQQQFRCSWEMRLRAEAGRSCSEETDDTPTA